MQEGRVILSGERNTLFRWHGVRGGSGISQLYEELEEALGRENSKCHALTLGQKESRGKGEWMEPRLGLVMGEMPTKL